MAAVLARADLAKFADGDDQLTRRDTSEIFRRAQQRGVILGESRYAGLGNLIKVKPPLDIPEALLVRALDVVDEVVVEVERDFGYA